jgi:UDP-glucose 4-epimerase
MQRWLFTGGSGRVGRMLMRHWAQQAPQSDIIVQARRIDERGETNRIVWDPLVSLLPPIAGDVTCIIAFAGVTPATGGLLNNNAALAEATLAAAFAARIPRVILASSSAIYGMNQTNSPFRETDEPRPINAYGAAKFVMEEICKPWRKRGLEVCCLRIGNVAGADVLLLNGTNATINAPLRIDRFADGQGPRRSYIGPSTLARVVEALAACTQNLPSVLNVAAPQPIGMAVLAEAANMPWTWAAAPETATQDITLNVSSLGALYAFEPEDSRPAEMVRQWRSTKDSK